MKIDLYNTFSSLVEKFIESPMRLEVKFVDTFKLSSMEDVPEWAEAYYEVFIHPCSKDTKERLLVKGFVDGEFRKRILKKVDIYNSFKGIDTIEDVIAFNMQERLLHIDIVRSIKHNQGPLVLDDIFYKSNNTLFNATELYDYDERLMPIDLEFTDILKIKYSNGYIPANFYTNPNELNSFVLNPDKDLVSRKSVLKTYVFFEEDLSAKKIYIKKLNYPETPCTLAQYRLIRTLYELAKENVNKFHKWNDIYIELCKDFDEMKKEAESKSREPRINDWFKRDNKEHLRIKNLFIEESPDTEGKYRLNLFHDLTYLDED